MSTERSQPQDSNRPGRHARPPAEGESTNGGKQKGTRKNLSPVEVASRRPKYSDDLARLEAERELVARLDASTIERVARTVKFVKPEKSEETDPYADAIERLLKAENARQCKLESIENKIAEAKQRLEGPSLSDAIAEMPLYWVPHLDAAKQRNAFSLPNLPAEMGSWKLLPFSKLRDNLRYTIEGKSKSTKSEIAKLPEGAELVGVVREWLDHESKGACGIRAFHSTPQGDAYCLTNEIQIPLLRQWVRLRCGVEGKGSSMEKAREAYQAFRKRKIAARQEQELASRRTRTGSLGPS